MQAIILVIGDWLMTYSCCYFVFWYRPSEL